MQSHRRAKSDRFPDSSQGTPPAMQSFHLGLWATCPKVFFCLFAEKTQRRKVLEKLGVLRAFAVQIPLDPIDPEI